MSNFLKNILGIVLILVLAVGGYALFQITKTYSRSSEPTNFRSFTVTGDGKASGTPDVAEFSFDVITEGGNDVAKLQSDNAAKMNGALEFVKKQGIDAKDITTQQYSINPRYQTVACNYETTKVCPPATIVGYTVTQSTNVKIRDFTLISALLKGVVDNGANSVSQIQFTIDNPTEVENIARAEAIKKAQDKAKSIADAGGFKIGRLLEINENNSGYYPMYSRVAMDAGATKEASIAPTIEPGSQEVNISATLKYEIE